jgi:hypothetical protein
LVKKEDWTSKGEDNRWELQRATHPNTGKIGAGTDLYQVSKISRDHGQIENFDERYD